MGANYHQDDDLEFETVAETCRALDISRCSLYRLLKAGELSSIKVLNSRRISVKSRREFIARGGSRVAA
jgi:hypothetical protein